MKAKLLFICTTILCISAQAAQAQDKPINGVLTAYFTLKNDLVADNSAAAKTDAAELTAAIKAVPADRIPAAQQAAWKKIALSTTHVGEAKDIDTERDYFAVLSDNLIAVTKALKVNAAPVYQQYCPMKKANWLSETAAIKNPFYGKMMLTCGQVTETLAAVK